MEEVVQTLAEEGVLSGERGKYRVEKAPPKLHISPTVQVALKTMRRELSTDLAFAQRFLREVRVATQLRSPHTVTVHDSGQGEDGQLYFVMEYINGPRFAR